MFKFDQSIIPTDLQMLLNNNENLSDPSSAEQFFSNSND